MGRGWNDECCVDKVGVEMVWSLGENSFESVVEFEIEKFYWVNKGVIGLNDILDC